MKEKVIGLASNVSWTGGSGVNDGILGLGLRNVTTVMDAKTKAHISYDLFFYNSVKQNVVESPCGHLFTLMPISVRLKNRISFHLGT